MTTKFFGTIEMARREFVTRSVKRSLLGSLIAASQFGPWRRARQSGGFYSLAARPREHGFQFVASKVVLRSRIVV